MEIDKTEIVKSAVGWVVAGGTALIVKGFIENNTSPENFLQRGSVAIASVVIGGMAKDATRKYTDEQIDKLVAAWTNVVDNVKAMRA